MVQLSPYQPRIVERQATFASRRQGPGLADVLAPAGNFAAGEARRDAQRAALVDQRRREREAEEQRAQQRRDRIFVQQTKARAAAEASRWIVEGVDEAPPGAPGFASSIEARFGQWANDTLAQRPEGVSPDAIELARQDLETLSINVGADAYAAERRKREEWEGSLIDSSIEDFSTNAFLDPNSLPSTIEQFEAALGDMDLGEGAIAEYMAQARESFALAAAQGLVSSDPDRLMRELSGTGGAIGGNISQKMRVSMMSAAQAERARRDAEAERAAAARAAIAREDVRFAVSVLDSGGTPEGLARTRAMAESTPYAPDLAAAERRHGQVAGFRVKPVAEQVATLRQMAESPVSPNSAALFASYQKVFSDTQMAIRNGTVLERARELGLDVPPVDLSDGSSLIGRFALSGEAARHLGIGAAPLLDTAERQDLARRLAEGNPSDNAALIAGVSAAVPREVFDKLAEELGDVGYGPEYQYAADRLRRNPYETGVAAQIISAARTKVEDLGIDEDVEKAVRQAVAQSFEETVGAATRAQAALRADGGEVLQDMMRHRAFVEHYALVQAARGVGAGQGGPGLGDYLVGGGFYALLTQGGGRGGAQAGAAAAVNQLFGDRAFVADPHAQILVDTTEADPERVSAGLAAIRETAPQVLAELRSTFENEFAFNEFVDDIRRDAVWVNYGSGGYALVHHVTQKPISLPGGSVWVVTAEEAAAQ